MTPTLIKIDAPIWNGGAYKVGIKGKTTYRGEQITIVPSQAYTIKVLYTNKHGDKSVPETFIMRGRDIQKYPLVPTKKYPNTFLHWIPIADLTTELADSSDICQEHNAIKLADGRCVMEVAL